jgi:hypothetical protein
VQSARSMRVVGNQDNGPAEPLRNVGGQQRTCSPDNAGDAGMRAGRQALSERRQDFGFGETFEEFVHHCTGRGSGVLGFKGSGPTPWHVRNLRHLRFLRNSEFWFLVSEL